MKNRLKLKKGIKKFGIFAGILILAAVFMHENPALADGENPEASVTPTYETPEVSAMPNVEITEISVTPTAEITEMPEIHATPTAEITEMPEIHVTPTAEITEMSEIYVTPTVEITENTEASITPAAETPAAETPAAETSEIHETPETSETLETSETPETSETLESPETPGTSETSETPTSAPNPLYPDGTCVYEVVYNNENRDSTDEISETDTDADSDIDTDSDVSLSALYDKNIETGIAIAKGKSLKITSEATISGIYIIWEAGKIPESYEITINDKVNSYTGKFLHEYIDLSDISRSGAENTGTRGNGNTDAENSETRSDGNTEGTESISTENQNFEFDITFLSKTGIKEIYVLTDGVIPDFVEMWEDTLENADVLIFAAHAGDETLDFGALITDTVKKAEVQIVYMCEYVTTDEELKEHEKLNNLWKLGIRNYPVTGEFRNKFLRNETAAEKFYVESNITKFVTECIRRFKAQVVVTHDTDGEYGNYVHKLLAASVKDAVSNSGNENYFLDSAQKYGTWNVKKSYFHCLSGVENVTMEIDFELLTDEEFETIKTMSDLIVSGEWCGRHFTDITVSSVNSIYFELFESTVGTDTGNDIMQNIVTYAEQRRIKAEEEKKAAEERQRLYAEGEAQLKRSAVIGERLFGRFSFGKIQNALKKLYGEQ